MGARRTLAVAALILSLGLAGVAGFVIAHNTNVTVMTGTFYVGDHEATAAVGGKPYSIVGSVPWLDSTNAWHEDGWPSCLGPVGTYRAATFGEATVDGPTTSWSEVLWVSCANLSGA
jgi:hypothetical protein